MQLIYQHTPFKTTSLITVISYTDTIKLLTHKWGQGNQIVTFPFLFACFESTQRKSHPAGRSQLVTYTHIYSTILCVLRCPIWLPAASGGCKLYVGSNHTFSPIHVLDTPRCQEWHSMSVCRQLTPTLNAQSKSCQTADHTKWQKNITILR